MGLLRYGVDVFPFDDRTLLHVQIAIHEALRHERSFFLSWRVRPEDGSGRVSVRITPHVPILFQFDGGRPARINRVWVDTLVASALGGTGLIISPEPEAPSTIA
jgi:hypothetical protein